MSYSNFLLACENIQERLDRAWIDPALWQGTDDKMPFPEYITSPANTAGIVQLVSPGGGKLRNVTVKYRHRIAESEAEYNQPNPNCEATIKRGENYQDYSLDPEVNIQHNEQIGLSDFETVCESNQELVDEAIRRMIDAMDRNVGTMIANQSALLTGGWSSTLPSGTGSGQVDGSERLVIPTRLADGVNPNPRGITILRNALDDTGYPDNIFLSGGKLMREYMQFVNSGCCTSFGVDIGDLQAQFGYAYAYDKRLEAALGSTVSGAGDRFMALAPRALQLLRFSRAEGKAAMGTIWSQSSNYAYMSVRSPRFGIWYDLSAKDPCGTLNLNLTFTGKMVALPSDMYSTADDLNGVTWASQVQITNP